MAVGKLHHERIDWIPINHHKGNTSAIAHSKQEERFFFFFFFFWVASGNSKHCRGKKKNPADGGSEEYEEGGKNKSEEAGIHCVSKFAPPPRCVFPHTTGIRDNAKLAYLEQ